GVTNVTVTATNECGSDTENFIISVTDDEDPTVSVANAAVTANTSDDEDGNCTVSLTIGDATFDDNCSVASLTWEMTGVTTGSSAAEGINQVGIQSFNIGVT